MATDCTELSVKAREIFEKLKPHFPPDPWGKELWTDKGLVYSNGWFDLRKSAHRSKLEELTKKFIGYSVGLDAKGCREKTGSFEGFTSYCYSPLIKQHAELLVLLQDLDYQIETGDIVDAD